MYRICTRAMLDLQDLLDPDELGFGIWNLENEDLYRGCRGSVQELYRICTGSVQDLYDLYWSCTGSAGSAGSVQDLQDLLDMYRICRSEGWGEGGFGIWNLEFRIWNLEDEDRGLW